MSYYGAYYGAIPTVTVVESSASGPEPIEAETTTIESTFVDHAAVAIDRLCEYAKTKASAQ